MNEKANRIIDDLGGTGETAALCGRTKGAVSQWRVNGIPDAIERFLRAVRPDVFESKDQDQKAA